MKREPLVLAFAIVFPSVMAWLYFVVVSPAENAAPGGNLWMQLLYSTGKIVQFGTPIAWVLFVERYSLRSFFAKTPDLPDRNDSKEYSWRFGLWFGIAAAAIAFVIYIVCRPEHDLLQQSDLFFGVPQQIREKLRQFNAMTPMRYFALVAFLSIVNSFLEEYYWRWFVFGRLRKYMPVFAAIVISSLAFMGHHVIVLWVYFPGRFWSAVVPFSLAIAFGGAVWAWLYHKSGSIVGPWISHLIVDVAVMSIGYDLAFRQ